MNKTKCSNIILWWADIVNIQNAPALFKDRWRKNKNLSLDLYSGVIKLLFAIKMWTLQSTRTPRCPTAAAVLPVCKDSSWCQAKVNQLTNMANTGSKFAYLKTVPCVWVQLGSVTTAAQGLALNSGVWDKLAGVWVTLRSPGVWDTLRGPWAWVPEIWEPEIWEPASGSTIWGSPELGLLGVFQAALVREWALEAGLDPCSPWTDWWVDGSPSSDLELCLVRWPILDWGLLPAPILDWGLLPSSNLDCGLLPSPNLEWGLLPSATLEWGLLPSAILEWGLLPSATLEWGLLPSATLEWGLVPPSTLECGLVSSPDLEWGLVWLSALVWGLVTPADLDWGLEAWADCLARPADCCNRGTPASHSGVAFWHDDFSSNTDTL